jgi:hypothetical protein
VADHDGFDAAMTTLLAPVPFVDDHVRALRVEHDWSAHHGVGAHITLLGPFLHPDDVTSHTLARLQELFAAQAPVGVEISEVQLLGSSACLLLTSTGRLRALTEALRRQWPQAPPMPGAYHITVARHCDAVLFEEVTALVTPRLPVSGCLADAELWERRCDGAVEQLARFPLNGSA